MRRLRLVKPADSTTDRTAVVRAGLEARRRELINDIASRLRESRAARPNAAGDISDVSDVDVEEDLDHSLLQMRSETLARIDDAIQRLDAGKYGWCVECDNEIAARRLLALPFAVRCRACEDSRERPAAQRRPGILIDLGAPRS